MNKHKSKPHAGKKKKISFKPYYGQPFRHYSIFCQSPKRSPRCIGNILAPNGKLAMAKAVENFGSIIKPECSLFVAPRNKKKRRKKKRAVADRQTPRLIKQAKDLHATAQEVVNAHQQLYVASEYFFALSQDRPEWAETSELSLFTAYCQDIMFNLLSKVERFIGTQ